MLAGDPRGHGWSAHLPRPAETCDQYEHGFTVEPVPVSALCDDMLAWARMIGWEPGPGASVRELLLYDRRAVPDTEVRLDADEMVFALLIALGLPAMPSPQALRLDASAMPYRRITARIGGLGPLAYGAMRWHLEDPAAEPLADWVPAALRLHDDLWQAQLEPLWTEHELLARIDHVRSLRAAAAPGL
jgi:hypothetical protein